MGLRPLLGGLGEHVFGNLVAVEGSRGTRVGLDMDEQFDDLLLRDATVEGDPQLPAQGFVRAEDCRDRHRDECAAAGVEARSRPGISERVPRGEPGEVSAYVRLAGPSGSTSGTPSRCSAAAYAA
jgi:hypothetical protein